MRYLFGALNFLSVRQCEDLGVVALCNFIEGLRKDPAHYKSHYYWNSYQNACTSTGYAQSWTKGRPLLQACLSVSEDVNCSAAALYPESILA